MDGIHAMGATFDASYSMTYATLAGAGAAAGGTGAAGDTAETSGAYEAPGALSEMLSGMDDQTRGLIIALLVLSMLTEGQASGDGMEDMLSLLGSALAGGQGEHGGTMMAMQSMTLSFSYESIMLGGEVPMHDSHGGLNALA